MLLLAFTLITSLPAGAQDIYEHFSKDLEAKHVKRMLKVFESIGEEKWESAQKKLEDFDEKVEKMRAKHADEAENLLESLRPLPDLARAMIDISPAAATINDGEKHNAWTAYELLKKVERDRYARYVDEFLRLLEKTPMKLGDIIEKNENILHKEVAEQNTVEAYEWLLRLMRKNSKIRIAVNSECEQLTFNEVIVSNSIGRCKDYLDRFPMSVNKENYKRVTDYRDSLAYAAAPQTEQGMREYLKDYPNSYIANKAKNKLYEYAFLNLPHTEKAYKKYTMEFPDSPRLMEARDSMMSCAWYTTLADSTYKAFDSYCRTYPKAKNINEAKDQRLMAGRREFARLSAKEIPEELLSDSIIANFIKSKKNSPYSRYMYGIRAEHVDTLIETVSGAKGERRIYIFDEDGLLAQENISQKGSTYYEYGMEEGLGFYLAMMTPPSGKMVTYTARFTPNGRLVELTGSDGTRETYEYRDVDNTIIRSTYAKAARTATQTERYVNGRLMETMKAGVRTVYEYNEQGDISRRMSNSGSKVLSLCTFEYTYDENGCWTERRQRAVDGSIQETRKRTYITTVTSSLNI